MWLLPLLADAIENDYLLILVYIICCLMGFMLIVRILSNFLQDLDYLAKSLFQKIKALFGFIKHCIIISIKIIFWPITIYKIYQENKFYNQFIIIQNELKDPIIYD